MKADVFEAIALAIRKGYVRLDRDGRYVITVLGKQYTQALRGVVLS